jgi:hypothetical protein
MTTEKLVKLVGIGLTASGVLATIGFSIHPHDPLGANYVPWIGGHVLIFLGFMAGFLGLVGLYGVVAKAVGVAGFIGFLLASMSITLYLGKLYWSGFIYPLVIEQYPSFIADQGLEPGSHPSDVAVRSIFYLARISHR